MDKDSQIAWVGKQSGDRAVLVDGLTLSNVIAAEKHGMSFQRNETFPWTYLVALTSTTKQIFIKKFILLNWSWIELHSGRFSVAMASTVLKCISFVKLISSKNILFNTRMHSSGMGTARLLTMSQHALWLGEGECTCLGCTCLGCTCPGGVPARGV